MASSEAENRVAATPRPSTLTRALALPGVGLLVCLGLALTVPTPARAQQRVAAPNGPSSPLGHAPPTPDPRGLFEIPADLASTVDAEGGERTLDDDRRGGAAVWGGSSSRAPSGPARRVADRATPTLSSRARQQLARAPPLGT